MNKVYRSVWNATTNTWAAAAETAKSRSKGSARAARRAVVALALGGASMGGAFAAEVCTTEDGKKGALDSAGTCVVSAPQGRSIGLLGGTDGGTATGTNATALGPSSDAAGTQATALGFNSKAPGVVGTAVGSQTEANGLRSTALGGRARADAERSVALGASSVANRENTISVGSDDPTGFAGVFTRQIVNVAAGTEDTDAVNFGQMKTALSTKVDNNRVKVGGTTDATVSGAADNIAIGSGAQSTAASGSGSVAVGGQSAATGNNSTAVGAVAKATATNATAVGGNATVTGESGVGVGQSSDASGTGAVALGFNTHATASRSVALGIGAVADRDNTVSVGTTAVGGQRQIVNMAAGTQANDAVNVSQLKPVVDALGGNATINPDGSVTGPTYTLKNGSGLPQATVGGALDELDTSLTATNTNVTNLTGRMSTAETNITRNTTDITQIRADMNNGSIGLVQQAGAGADLTVGKDTNGAAVNFAGTAGNRKLIGVADGAVTTVSKEAINGSQLRGVSDSVASAIGAGSTVNPDGSITAPSFTVGDGNGGTTIVHNVGAAVTNLNDRVTINEGDITTLQQQVGNGTIGLVQQAGTGANLTVGKDTDGAAVDFTGKAGARKLTGVADGAVTTVSKEAINGSQLRGVSDSVAAAIGAGSTVNPDGSITAPSFTVGDGNGGTTIVRNVGAAVENLNDRVTVNEGDITNIRNDLSNGSVGLVRQDQTTGAITVAAGTGGDVVNFGGTAGDRRLTGVANGTADNDAASIAQLKAMGLFDPNNNLPLAAVVYDGIDLKNVTFGGTGGTYLNNVAPGLIGAGSMQAVNGSQLFALDQKLENYYSNLDGRVGVIEQGAGSGGGSGGGSGDFSGSGTGSTQIGAGSNASGDYSTAIGNGSAASGENSTAIGQGSSATGSGSVAIGQGSTADRENTVSVGSDGLQRQITNVAEGTAGTDAVNVNQLNRNVANLQNQIDSNRRDAAGGTATAVAMANLPQAALPGESVMSLASGTYDGESAMAIGVSTATKDGKWLLKATGSTNTRGSSAVGAGVGYRW